MSLRTQIQNINQKIKNERKIQDKNFKQSKIHKSGLPTKSREKVEKVRIDFHQNLDQVVEFGQQRWSKEARCARWKMREDEG